MGITEFEDNKTNKFLGINEACGINHIVNKENAIRIPYVI